MEIQSRPELAFDEQQHLYTLGGLVLPSVTQIMSPMSSMLYAAVPQAALDAAADRGTRAHEQVTSVAIGHFSASFDDSAFTGKLTRKTICDAAYSELLLAGLLYRGLEGRMAACP